MTFDETEAHHLLRLWDAAMVLTGKLNKRIEIYVADKTSANAEWTRGLLDIQAKRNTLMQAVAVAEIALMELRVPIPLVRYERGNP